MDSMLCESCGLEVKSSIHILIDCRWVKEIWLLIQTWCDVYVTHATTIEDLLSRKHNYFQRASHQKVFHAIFLTVLWGIWRAKNDLIFNKLHSSPSKVFEDIKTLTFLWIKSRVTGFLLNWELWCIFLFRTYNLVFISFCFLFLCFSSFLVLV